MVQYKTRSGRSKPGGKNFIVSHTSKFYGKTLDTVMLQPRTSDWVSGLEPCIQFCRWLSANAQTCISFLYMCTVCMQKLWLWESNMEYPIFRWSNTRFNQYIKFRDEAKPGNPWQKITFLPLPPSRIASSKQSANTNSAHTQLEADAIHHSAEGPLHHFAF